MAHAHSLSTKSPRTLLLTFDAFGTLFYPRAPVPQQYAAVAHEFGLCRNTVTPQKIEQAFGDVYPAHTKLWPNYGRADVIHGRYGGPRQWWEEVMRECFARVMATTSQHRSTQRPHSKEFELPLGMADVLLNRFSSDEGYALFEDVLPFFTHMRELRRAPARKFDRIILGVVSNSDDRVPAVLKALGLRVGDMRADQDLSSMELPGFEHRGRSKGSCPPGQSPVDVDLVITSYEAGEGKPGRLIFDVAKRQARLLSSMPPPAHGATPEMDETDNWVCVHVGDEYEKDYRAAINAGWQSYLIRENRMDVPARPINSLVDLIQELEI